MAVTAVSGAGGRNSGRRRWIKMFPLLVVMVVVGEIWFLGRLDVAKNAAMLQSWTSEHLFPSSISSVYRSDIGAEVESCEEWLERLDAVQYGRDFDVEPILVNDSKQNMSSCAVGCKFGSFPGKTPDATLGSSQDPSTVSVLRSMESSHYYLENKIDNARRRGYGLIMTTSLLSDVPVGYFSWAEYDIMAPLQPKTSKALAAAFISNCGARNFRLQALEMLEKSGIEIDSYGACHRNRDGQVDKVQTLKKYKFSLAFENSNEDDYVTEKFFQSLVAGAIPVVVGAPNIRNFAPSPTSFLHIKELIDITAVAERMKFLDSNPEAYNESLRWKFDGPSNSFKALVDMAAVHSSCRLCIHLATAIRDKEEQNANSKRRRPCKCTRRGLTLHHIYVRERGTLDFTSVFLRSDNLNVKALESRVLERFTELKHVPVWKRERPDSLRGGNQLVLYRVYPAGLTQREALYSFRFRDDHELELHLESHPCAKFEVIFV